MIRGPENSTWEGITPTQALERGVMSLILETIQTEGIAQLSYLVGDDGPGTAAVIDPRSDVEVYVELARQRGLAITHIVETHIHADFVSGSRELADRVKTARIHVSVEGAATYAFEHEPIEDGASFEFGEVTLTARHTPWAYARAHVVFGLRDKTCPNTLGRVHRRLAVRQLGRPAGSDG
jgi:hydroxyacylglutathione hydrolase